MYRRDGAVYQVVKSKNDKLYAKRVDTVYVDGVLHKLELHYAPGLIFNIDARDRMTADEVAQLGKLTGRCYVCRHKLTVAKSIAAGIGSICAKKV